MARVLSRWLMYLISVMQPITVQESMTHALKLTVCFVITSAKSTEIFNIVLTNTNNTNKKKTETGENPACPHISLIYVYPISIQQQL